MGNLLERIRRCRHPKTCNVISCTPDSHWRRESCDNCGSYRILPPGNGAPKGPWHRPLLIDVLVSQSVRPSK